MSYPVRRITLNLLAVFSMCLLANSVSAESTKTKKAKVPVEERATALLEKQLSEADSRRIPISIRRTARCVAVFPFVVKAGIVIAGQRGQGLVTCRKTSADNWGAPAYFNITAASIGIQAGIQEASIILMAMTKSAADAFINEKISFGGNVGVTAGPIGASTMVDPTTAVASYIRAEGLFAGIDLDSSNISFVKKANAAVYGKDKKAREILLGDTAVPEKFSKFHATLRKLAPAVTESSPDDVE